MHKKNKSQTVFCENNHLNLMKFNDNFSEKSKFKSTMDYESYEASKLKNDNLTSASYLALSNKETGITFKSLRKIKSCNITY